VTVALSPPLIRRATEAERALFDRKLAQFIPPDPFDVHAHLYTADHGPQADEAAGNFGMPAWSAYAREWMGSSAPSAGLFFGFPSRGVDPSTDNRWVLDQVHDQAGSRALMLVRPGDDPDDIARRIAAEGWAGLKVYHTYAAGDDTFNAPLDAFLPQWMWEVAHRHRAVILLHMVLPHALADARNQSAIRERCIRYPDAQLILAHAARGFCADHTLDGLDALGGLHNVFFDTSAVCESGALIAILQRFGAGRLMYGSDFPVSQHRGRHVSVGDGFFWLHDHNADYTGWKLGQPVLVGIESLLALRQAARLCHLRDGDLERIFGGNARLLLGLVPTPTGERTRARYAHARALIPGGTQLLSKRPEMFAPEAWPAYFTEAHGIEVTDLDGRRFLDFSICGIGSTPLGYADPDVNAAVARRVMLGSMCTLNPADEVELAELLIDLHPWSQQVRYTRTGGEAMAVAVRIARAATRRNKVTFCGYHGWSDWYLAANLTTVRGDQLQGHLLPGLDPAGVPAQLSDTALPFTYNHLDQLETILHQHGDDVAAIVMEPMRHQPPLPGFLEGVRAAADRAGAVLVFDEITTGWRFECGGLHLRLQVQPDIVVFSKAIANGFPLGALVGKRHVMEAAQASFISSTMWTEAVGPSAALAAIRKIRDRAVPAHIDRIGQMFQATLRRLADRHGLPIRVGGPAPLTHVRFEHDSAAALLTLYIRLMLERGILASGGFYPTFAHQPHDIEAFAQAVDQVFPLIRDAMARGDVLQRIGGCVRHDGFARLT